MKRYGSAIVMLVVLCTLAVSGRARLAEPEDLPGLPSIPPAGHQTIRASVVDKNPAHYTIDVRKFANIGVNEDAPTFAIYMTSALPTKCGDFTEVDLHYWKVSKYKRGFNLSEHPEVLKAIKAYGCIVLRNSSAPPQVKDAI